MLLLSLECAILMSLNNHFYTKDGGDKEGDSQVAKKKKRVFRKELIILTMSIYISAMLILGITFSWVSVTLFSRKASDDMKFYLENIGTQFENKTQFMEDIVTTIRHNIMLSDFFEDDYYQIENTKQQLAYNSNLFSERNMVDSRFPFVERVFIFNKKKEYQSNLFYPTTVSDVKKVNLEYQQIYQTFLDKNLEFDYQISNDMINVCMRLYNSDMEYMGVCITALNKQTLQYMFSDLEKYNDCMWAVRSASGEVMVSKNFLKENFDLRLELPGTHVLEQDIDKSTWLIGIGSHGFGLKTVVGVKQNVVYNSIVPTVITFVVIFIVLLLGIAIVVFYLTHRFTRPLKVIADYIRDFGKGDGGLKTRLTRFTTEEFDDISIVFNEMTDRINDLITQNYEKKLLATQSQVRFLQSQINPHFMFNILSMIGMRAKIQGNDEVMDMLTAFSKLIQGKIFRKGELKIPLREEMELVGFYLYLQSNRFRDKITYDIRYDTESVKENLIPRLCIEPMVENAVSHGLEQKEGSGKIDIYIYEKDQRLFIVITDDGIGFNVSKIMETKREADANHVHVGLTNTIELIHILYGDLYGVEIDSEEGVGTKVIIQLPIEKENSDH